MTTNTHNATTQPGALITPKCDDCNVLCLQGLACHETGCPSRHIDPCTGEPYPVECKGCGCMFSPEERHQVYCDEGCVL